MYTGIIHNQARVAEKRKKGKLIRFLFLFLKKEKPMVLGESIAVDGVCLTVSQKARQGFWVDVVKETLEATTLGKLKPGNRVNIERSLTVGDTLGGHFVTGHIDGRGRIEKIQKVKGDYLFYIRVPEQVKKMVIRKGSVAVDGISLTVQEVSDSIFKVTIIPHTFLVTTLGIKDVGDEVNIEVDLIARYMASLLEEMYPCVKSRITISKLQKQGF